MGPCLHTLGGRILCEWWEYYCHSLSEEQANRLYPKSKCDALGANSSFSIWIHLTEQVKYVWASGVWTLSFGCTPHTQLGWWYPHSPKAANFLHLLYRECRALTQCYEFHFLILAPASQMYLSQINVLFSECAQARKPHSHEVHVTLYWSLNCTSCRVQRISWRTAHLCMHLAMAIQLSKLLFFFFLTYSWYFGIRTILERFLLTTCLT